MQHLCKAGALHCGQTKHCGVQILQTCRTASRTELIDTIPVIWYVMICETLVVIFDMVTRDLWHTISQSVTCLGSHGICAWVQGLPEAEASGEVFKYSCQARSRLEGTLELRLEGLGRLTGTETFSHDLVIPVSKQSALKNALQLVPQFDNVTDPSQPLRFVHVALEHASSHGCDQCCEAQATSLPFLLLLPILPSQLA